MRERMSEDLWGTWWGQAPHWANAAWALVIMLAIALAMALTRR